ncbi:ABC transporter substrate-binding protein [Desertimonas flava]|uniref:ABC transporter substrate-binding protein n=1 Tax=Desertimonas flava TaxID=2064846 RepID=UPI0013C4FDE4|nr:extracellular solute-binding protein [Desertimonas flava]
MNRTLRTRRRRPQILAVATSTLAAALAAGASASAGSEPPADTASESSPSGSAGASEEEWQGIVDAANEEGSVTVYSVMLPNQNEALEAGFEETYPDIDMEVIRVLGEMDSKLDAERETNAEGADVGAHVNYQWVIDAAESGDLTEMVGPEARGPNWEGTPWNVDGLYQYSAFQLLGIGCNTDLAETCPTSYEETLSPEFEDLIGVVDPGSPVVTNFAVFLQEQLGEAGMEELRDLSPVFYDTAVPAQQGLAAGEVAITLYATAQLRADADAGAPVEFIVPTPAWSPPVLSYILGWAQHPNAAQLVLDYMATPEGQAAIAINGASALPGIEGTLADIEDVQPVDISLVTAEWAAPHQAEWQDFFGR